MAKFAVIIPAAGKSTRLAMKNRKKVFLELQGRAVWLRTAEHFTSRDDVAQTLIVISPEDPGIGNWMNTVGHRHGTLGLRWTRAIDPQKPKLRVVPIADLKAEAARRSR